MLSSSHGGVFFKKLIQKIFVFAIVGLLASPAARAELTLQNGWYVHQNEVIWGFAQQNGWWRAGTRPNLTRNAPGQTGPNRTEDLDALSSNMITHAYPGFEHNFGLWYDRRRDAHDTVCRSDSNVQSPFLEQPWARSGVGQACDGLSKYDLTQFNQWYFDRLRQFAALSDTKGTVLLHNFYMQHALLEKQAHYADFPWRPVNTIQTINMPDSIPAANAFYDVSDPAIHDLHRAYIRKGLAELDGFENVVHLASYEYTGPLEFMRFWVDTMMEWEQEKAVDLHIGLGATKDVQDAILADPVRGPAISTVDLRYWWYNSNGSLTAPQGGNQVEARYLSGGNAAAGTSPEQIYRQVREIRDAYPDKAIIHMISASRKQSWAFLMAGGSLIVQQLTYTPTDPASYIAPDQSDVIKPTYDFLISNLSGSLQRSRPMDLVSSPDKNWCLADPGNFYLVYALQGGDVQLDLSGSVESFSVQWFDPRTGNLTPDPGGALTGGGIVTLSAPDNQDWAALLLSSAGIDTLPPAAPTNLIVD